MCNRVKGAGHASEAAFGGENVTFLLESGSQDTGPIIIPTAPTISDRKGTDVATVEIGATVHGAAKQMSQRPLGAAFGSDGDRVVGISKEEDTKISECRSPTTSKRIRHFQVVEDNKLDGLNSSGDVPAYEVVDRQSPIEYLHGYLYNRT